MSDEAPLLSAIVSTYNAERFIRGCLDDLLQQTIADRMEIIVIDAASPQNEQAIVAEYRQRYDNIRYVRCGLRESLYASWNRGIQMARGKYVTNANTDDRHRRDGLEQLVAALENDPGAALAYADVAVTTRENATFDDVTPVVVSRWPVFDRRLLFQVSYIGPQPLWRRELHDIYGWFDASFVAAADYEFWLRLAVRERFVHIAEPLGLYLASPQSIEHRNPSRNWAESEAARERNWPAQWGQRPRPHGFFLRPNLGGIARALPRHPLTTVGELAAYARMLIGGRLRR